MSWQTKDKSKMPPIAGHPKINRVLDYIQVMRYQANGFTNTEIARVMGLNNSEDIINIQRNIRRRYKLEKI